jgi:hypothetical protein
MKKTSKHKYDNSDRQLSFDDLPMGETIPVPMENKGIGGELLNILSKGLYTNPLDAIREYVQNSIDANAEEVQIQITGNSVWVMDYGDGMNREQILQSREFGVSRKSLENNVGFRGIGIYSGFDLCERLIVRSKRLQEDFEHVLEFQFGDMRRKLEESRLDPDRPIISLPELLSENTYYRFEQSTAPDTSFTLVQLEDLSDSHIHKLSNVDVMRNYILNNLPVRFSSDFIYGDDIERNLRNNVPGYKSARIKLIIENAPPVIVEKPTIPELVQPRFGFVSDSRGRKLAYYWACLTSKNEAISSRGAQYQKFAGLVYKQKGFTIGNREHLAIHFTRKQLYPWWTGEIYVISPHIIPTSARDDFEAGPAKDSMEVAVKELLSGSNDSLQKIALEFQASRRADEVIDQCEKRIDEIDQAITAETFDNYRTYTELHEIIEMLKQHKNKAGDRVKANGLLKRAESLQKKAKKEIDQPTSVAERQKKAVQTTFGPFDTTSNGETDASNGSEQPGLFTQPPDSRPTSHPEEPFTLHLEDVIKQSGWEIEESDLPVITLIGEAIIDHLVISSPLYRRLMEDIRTRLDDLMEGK